MKFKIYRYKNKELLLYPIMGLLFGYFILHPISMVIFWYEINSSGFSFSELGSILSENLKHSFSFRMMPMSIAFALFGLIGGLVTWFYFKSLKEKQNKLQIKRQYLKQSIPTIIANGEDEFVEFKSSLRYDYRQIKTDKSIESVTLKSIAGFLNGKGGTLIIGVSNFGEILGLSKDYFSLRKMNKEGFQQRVFLLVSNAFGKDICSKIHCMFHDVDKVEICTLIIEPSNRPVYIKEKNRTMFYLRTGTVSNLLTTSETVKYLQSRKIH